MRRTPRLLLSDTRGSAAAEMMLVTPLLMVLMFGSFELGKYFLDEHALAKAVRDGSRYAARQNFSNYVDSGGACTVSDEIIEPIRNVTRTGLVIVDEDTPPRLSYWTDEETIAVTATCDTSGDFSGIYKDNAGGAPVVTVTAVVPYAPLFGSIAFDVGDFVIRATSQSPVTGI